MNGFVYRIRGTEVSQSVIELGGQRLSDLLRPRFSVVLVACCAFVKYMASVVQLVDTFPSLLGHQKQSQSIYTSKIPPETCPMQTPLESLQFFFFLGVLENGLAVD